MERVHSESELFESYQEHINLVYPLFLQKVGLDKSAVKAEGATITDSEGKIYIDCVGGYGLFNVGHNNPTIIQALIEQLNEKQLYTKPFITEVQVKAAEMLSEIAPGDLACSFICNSGSEAIDNAIKLARLHSGKKRIITAEHSFHGYTFGALSASGISSFKRLFEPLVPEIVQVPYGDAEAIRNAITEGTAAVLLEPIQHEAGVLVPADDYLPKVRQICDRKNVLLILDEIKTGFGKIGWMFACEKYGVVPDILVVGKSLGGGMIPIGALIAKKSLWRKFSMSFAMSASSFAGNALACRAAITTIEILRQDKLLEECGKKGAMLMNQIMEYCLKYPNILKEIKGMGLLLGVEIVSSQKAFQLSKEMIKQGIIMLPAYGNPSVLMIEPPIVVTVEQLQTVLQAFNNACNIVN